MSADQHPNSGGGGGQTEPDRLRRAAESAGISGPIVRHIIKHFAQDISIVPQELRRKSRRTIIRHFANAESLKRSGYAPNRHLTILMPRNEIRRVQGTGKAGSEYLRTDLFPAVRRFIQPLYGMWVIEVRNGPHAHILLHVPPRPASVEKRLSIWLLTRFGMDWDPVNPLAAIRQERMGTPVCLQEVDPSLSYLSAERTGFDGLVDYTAKSLVRNSCRQGGRRTEWVLGRCTGHFCLAGDASMQRLIA